MQHAGVSMSLTRSGMMYLYSIASYSKLALKKR